MINLDHDIKSLKVTVLYIAQSHGRFDSSSQNLHL